MTSENLILYGTTAGFKQYSGMVEQVMLGQVMKWNVMPDSMMGIAFDQKFVKEIAEKSGMPLKQHLDFYEGKHTKLEFASQRQELAEVNDGQDGAKILMHISGTFERLTEKRTFWRRKLKHYESNADLIARVRNSDEDNFFEIPYHGRMIVNGPNYALRGFGEFLLQDCTSKEYKFNLVSKAQHMAFIVVNK